MGERQHRERLRNIVFCECAIERAWLSIAGFSSSDDDSSDDDSAAAAPLASESNSRSLSSLASESLLSSYCAARLRLRVDAADLPARDDAPPRERAAAGLRSGALGSSSSSTAPASCARRGRTPRGHAAG